MKSRIIEVLSQNISLSSNQEEELFDNAIYDLRTMLEEDQVSPDEVLEIVYPYLRTQIPNEISVLHWLVTGGGIIMLAANKMSKAMFVSLFYKHIEGISLLSDCRYFKSLFDCIMDYGNHIEELILQCIDRPSIKDDLKILIQYIVKEYENDEEINEVLYNSLKLNEGIGGIITLPDNLRNWKDMDYV